MSILHRSLLASLALGLSSPAFSQYPVWNTEVSVGAIGARFLVPLDGGGALAVLDTGSPGGYAFARLDGQGNTVVQSEITTPWNPNAGLNGVSDQAGGAYFVGAESAGTIGGPSLGNVDAVVVRVDANGQELWAKRIGGVGIDIGQGILFDAGELVIVGRTSSPDFGIPATTGFGADGFLARLDPTDGSVLWVSRDRGDQEETYYKNVARTPQGEWLAAGHNVDFQVNYRAVVARYSSSGSLLSMHVNSAYSEINDISANGSGYVALAYDQGKFPSVTGFDASGAAQFTIYLSDSLFTVERSLVSISPDLFVFGGSDYAQAGQQTTQMRTMRAFNSTGAVLWDLQMPSPAGTLNVIDRLVVDSDGSLFAGGRVGFDPSVPGSQYNAWVGRISIDPFGVPGCAAQPNSTGVAASTIALGSDVRADNRVTLGTSSLPASQFGYYLASLTPDFVPGPGGSQGDLCLGGNIGRFNRAGEIQLSGSDGLFSLVLDLGDIPTPAGSVSAAAGQTWHFQSWYRDNNPGATSNFSSSVLVTLN